MDHLETSNNLLFDKLSENHILVSCHQFSIVVNTVEWELRQYAGEHNSKGNEQASLVYRPNRCTAIQIAINDVGRVGRFLGMPVILDEDGG